MDEDFEFKLGLCEEIFLWAESFRTSEGFQELLSFAKSEGLSSVLGRFDDAVWFYSGRWGHVPFRNGFGCNSRVYLFPDGRIVYTSNYKWMPTNFSLVFSEPGEMAEKLSPDYIKGLHGHVSSGRVFSFLDRALTAD